MTVAHFIPSDRLEPDLQPAYPWPERQKRVAETAAQPASMAERDHELMTRPGNALDDRWAYIALGRFE